MLRTLRRVVVPIICSLLACVCFVAPAMASGFGASAQEAEQGYTTYYVGGLGFEIPDSFDVYYSNSGDHFYASSASYNADIEVMYEDIYEETFSASQDECAEFFAAVLDELFGDDPDAGYDYEGVGSLDPDYDVYLFSAWEYYDYGESFHLFAFIPMDETHCVIIWATIYDGADEQEIDDLQSIFYSFFVADPEETYPAYPEFGYDDFDIDSVFNEETLDLLEEFLQELKTIDFDAFVEELIEELSYSLRNFDFEAAIDEALYMIDEIRFEMGWN